MIPKPSVPAGLPIGPKPPMVARKSEGVEAPM